MSSVSLRRSMVATVPCVAAADTTGCAPDEPDPDAGFFDVPNKRENIGAIVVTAGAGAANTHRETQMQQRNERTHCLSRARQAPSRKPPRTDEGARNAEGHGAGTQARAGEGPRGRRVPQIIFAFIQEGDPHK